MIARKISALTLLGAIAVVGFGPGCVWNPLSLQLAGDAGQGTGGQAVVPAGNNNDVGGNSAAGGHLGTGGSMGGTPGKIVTCTFGRLRVDKEPLSGYNESGIAVVAAAGDWQSLTGFGNPAPAISFTASAGTSTIGRVGVTAGGSLFRFASVDLHSSITTIPYVFTGLLGATTVFSATGTVPNSFGNFTTIANPNAGDLIDALEIALTNGTSCCQNPMSIDNIRLSM